jgi:hypothetical protein
MPQKIILVRDLIAKLEKLPQDLPCKYYRGQGRCSTVKDCRLVMDEALHSIEADVAAEPSFVCIF